MTDATREQIERDAEAYAESFKTGEWFEKIRKDAGVHMALHQHPIAFDEGWNAAVAQMITNKKLDRDYHIVKRDSFGIYTDGWLEHNVGLKDRILAEIRDAWIKEYGVMANTFTDERDGHFVVGFVKKVLEELKIK